MTDTNTPALVTELTQFPTNADAIQQYKIALIDICCIAAQLTKYNLPQIPPGEPEPSWYSSASVIWETLTARFQAWRDSTFATLMNIPTKLTSNDKEIVTPDFNDIFNNIQMIKDGTETSHTLSTVKGDLLEISNTIGKYQAQLQALCDDMNSGKGDFSDIQNQIDAILQEATSSVDSDGSKIAQLQADIVKLNQEISDDKDKLVGEGLMTGAGCLLIIAAIVAAPATGGGSLLLVIPGAVITGYGSSYIDLTRQQIKNDKQQVETDSQNIDGWNAQIAALVGMSSTLSGFQANATKISDALGIVSLLWTAALTEIDAMINALQAVESNTNFVFDETVIKTTESNWANLVASMPSLALDVTFAEQAIAQCGDDPNALQALIQSNTPIDIMTYLQQS